MALVKCKECGHQVSTTAKACPSCGAFTKIGAKKKPRFFEFGCLTLIVLIFIGVFMNNKDTRQSTRTPSIAQPTSAPSSEQAPFSTVPTKPLIPYQVFERLEPPQGGLLLRIIVDPKASKDQVLILASYMRDQNRGKGHVEIHIFDSIDAAQNQTNDNYPSDELFKHYLVCVRINPATNYENILWMASKKVDVSATPMSAITSTTTTSSSRKISPTKSSKTQKKSKIAEKKTDKSKGILTKDIVLASMNKNFPSMQKAKSSDETQRNLLFSKDKTMSIELIGNLNDLDKASLLFKYDTANSELLAEDVAMLYFFINNTVPGWSEGQDWLTSSIGKTVKKEATYENKIISVIAIAGNGPYCVTVEIKR